MTCPEIQDRLSAYLDGELTPEARLQVAEHIQTCAACQAELTLLERLEEALGALKAPVPLDLAERVLARLKPPRRPWWQNLALAASLVIGILLGGTVGRALYMQPVPRWFGTEIASLEAFQDFPEGSWGSLVVSYQTEEGNGA